MGPAKESQNHFPLKPFLADKASQSMAEKMGQTGFLKLFQKPLQIRQYTPGFQKASKVLISLNPHKTQMSPLSPIL